MPERRKFMGFHELDEEHCAAGAGHGRPHLRHCRGRASFVNRGDQAVDCDLLRIDFKSSRDEEYRFFPVRLGPGAREAHAAPRNNKWDVKGGGLLTFVDELFDLWYIAPPSRG